MAEPNATTTPAPFDLWAELEKIAAAESGGGGIVALCEIAVGYKVYAAGLPQAESFFATIPGNDASQKTAKASADALAQVHQVKAPRFGMQITARRDGATSRGVAVTWKDNRYFNVDIWTEAYKQVVGPSIKAAGVTQLPWNGWARLGFKPDPFKQAQGEAGMTDTDAQGNKRFPQVAYVVEVFPDEASAHASAAADAPSPVLPSDGNAPAWKPESDGWKAEDLQAIGVQLVEELKTKPLTQVAAEYSLTVADVLVALGEHKTKLPPVAVANKYKVDVAEVSKIREAAERIPF